MNTAICTKCGRQGTRAKGLCKRCYRQSYIEDNPEKHKNYVEKTRLLRKRRGNTKTVNTILEKHEDDLRDDTQRLSIEFIQSMINEKLKEKKTKISEKVAL